VVVGGAARRHGAARLLEGDHALQVMHGAPCAVLLVPEAEDVGAWAVDRVVVGLDETPEARAACALGAELARACGASLRLLAVVDDFPPTLGLGGYSVPLDWDEIIARAVEERGDMVRAAAERSRVAGAVAEVARGRPVDALVGASREADLLVLGSRRWGAVRRLALGSTTARVLREAHCPVLVPPRTADEPSAEPEAAEQATAG
jgi:nucleotide-binding universal stress UspA family protein